MENGYFTGGNRDITVEVGSQVAVAAGPNFDDGLMFTINAIGGISTYDTRAGTLTIDGKLANAYGLSGEKIQRICA